MLTLDKEATGREEEEKRAGLGRAGEDSNPLVPTPLFPPPNGKGVNKLVYLKFLDVQFSDVRTGEIENSQFGTTILQKKYCE